MPQPLAVFPEGTTGDGRPPAAVPLDLARSGRPAAARRRPSARSRSIMATHADVVGWHSGEPGMANVHAGARPPRDDGRHGPPARPACRRPTTARRWPAHARQAIAAALVFRARADWPIGATQMTDLPKTFRIKSFGCQMNVYDGERMAELLGAQGMTRGRRRRGRRPGRAQHLPHPREGRRKGLFRRRPPAPRGRQQADDRARRLRRPGRRRRGQGALAR